MLALRRPDSPWPFSWVVQRDDYVYMGIWYWGSAKLHSRGLHYV